MESFETGVRDLVVGVSVFVGVLAGAFEGDKEFGGNTADDDVTLDDTSAGFSTEVLSLSSD